MLNSEEHGLITPNGLISKPFSFVAHRLFVQSLSYLTIQMSSCASPTVSKRLESAWKHGPYNDMD